MNKIKKIISVMKNYTSKFLNEFTEKFKACDKSILVSGITAGIFILLGLIQLISVIVTPLARTFDHISLIPIDFMIAAFCVVYVLYRRGRLGGLKLFHELAETPDSESDEPDSPDNVKKSDTDKISLPDISRICIPVSQINANSSSVRSTSSVNSRVNTSASYAENENMFSPRHRYSGNQASRQNPCGSSDVSSKFNSHRSGR